MKPWGLQPFYNKPFSRENLWGKHRLHTFVARCLLILAVVVTVGVSADCPRSVQGHCIDVPPQEEYLYRKCLDGLIPSQGLDENERCAQFETKERCSYYICLWAGLFHCQANTEENAVKLGQQYNLKYLYDPPENLPPEWVISKSSINPDMTIVKIPRLFNETLRDTFLGIREHWDFDSMRQNDRVEDLVFDHQVHRVEGFLKIYHPDIYEKLVESLLRVDAAFWRQTDNLETVFPEIELIQYGPSEVYGISPHYDNDSIVTAVLMLSDPNDYRGGRFVAEPLENDAPYRLPLLEMGDAIFFRGEALSHWVTPIRWGSRKVLQIELGRVRDHVPSSPVV